MSKAPLGTKLCPFLLAIVRLAINITATFVHIQKFLWNDYMYILIKDFSHFLTSVFM